MSRAMGTPSRVARDVIDHGQARRGVTRAQHGFDHFIRLRKGKWC
jgi:hypothetical protein